MSVSDAPESTPQSNPATDTAGAQPGPAWKPEPRQWSWRDLFTAPMLAFKPKCMAIGALTIAVLALWWWLFLFLAYPGTWTGNMPIIGSLVHYLTLLNALPIWHLPLLIAWIIGGLVIFSLGATLISVFMKADLLDDEFLSLSEALAQYKSRVLPAVLVPSFLIGLLVGVVVFLLWVPMLIGSIPYAGSLLYALLYPLGLFMGIFAVLLGLAILLGIFVFPGIIAVRRHGWFDNVVDTIEAVGTKPHILVASLFLTGLLAWAAYSISHGGMNLLTAIADSRFLLGQTELKRTEARANDVNAELTGAVDPESGIRLIMKNGFGAQFNQATQGGQDPFIAWGPGLITGLWKALFTALILGYCLNIFLGGGILTYLMVREDDYWDDEDLEDLDQLAKELEDEAKREQAGPPAAGAPAAPVSAPASPPTAG